MGGFKCGVINSSITSNLAVFVKQVFREVAKTGDFRALRPQTSIFTVSSLPNNDSNSAYIYYYGKVYLVLILEMNVLPVGHISFSVQLTESLTFFLGYSLIANDFRPSSVLPDVWIHD